MSRSIKGKNYLIAAGLVGFIGVMAATPLFFSKTTKPLLNNPDKLTATQRQRGLYMGAGQHDVGADPDWDLEKRVWKGKRNFPRENTNGDYTKDILTDNSTNEK